MALAFSTIRRPIRSARPFCSWVSGAHFSNSIPRLVSYAFVLFQFISPSNRIIFTTMLYRRCSQFTAFLIIGRFSFSFAQVVKYAKVIPVVLHVIRKYRLTNRPSCWYPSHPFSRSNQSRWLGSLIWIQSTGYLAGYFCHGTIRALHSRPALLMPSGLYGSVARTTGSGLPMLVVALLSTGLNIGSELDLLLQRRYGHGYMLYLLDVWACTDHELVLSSRVFLNRHGRRAGRFSSSSLCPWLRAAKVTPGSWGSRGSRLRYGVGVFVFDPLDLSGRFQLLRILGLWQSRFHILHGGPVAPFGNHGTVLDYGIRGGRCYEYHVSYHVMCHVRPVTKGSRKQDNNLC